MSETQKKRIVVKVGTSTLTHDGFSLNLRSFDRLARVLSDISNRGWEVILVSSGAIAVGAGKLRMSERPKSLELKQAAASVGQCELMHLYDKFFGEYGHTIGQILLTADDIGDPVIARNLRNTFDSLLSLNALPIVNENDSVNVSEIEAEHLNRKIFGDNDTLSAMVAVLCEADSLVLLSDIDGLFSADPRKDENAALIPQIDEITDEVRALAGGAGSSRGTGGMITKLQAAELAMQNGIDMIICNGKDPDALYDITDGRTVGTLFKGRRNG